jgi:hypothetical protein
LKDALADFVKNNPGTTQNKLDNLAGIKGQFRAAKEDIRTAMKELQGEGRVNLKTLTKEGQKALGVPHQAKQVYEYVE